LFDVIHVVCFSHRLSPSPELSVSSAKLMKEIRGLSFLGYTLPHSIRYLQPTRAQLITGDSYQRLTTRLSKKHDNLKKNHVCS
jgi:hypothetical protein